MPYGKNRWHPCPQCGTEISPRAKLCRPCSYRSRIQPDSPRRHHDCKDCGATIENRATRCRQCYRSREASTPMEKRCPTCGLTKVREHFGLRSNGVNLRSLCKGCANDKSRRWYNANPSKAAESFRRWKLRSAYGLTQDDYMNMLSNQEGGCALCSTTDPGKKKHFYVDHCHKTGIVRGLLCNDCNIALGLFRDQPEVMRKAASYIERFR